MSNGIGSLQPCSAAEPPGIAANSMKKKKKKKKWKYMAGKTANTHNI